MRQQIIDHKKDHKNEHWLEIIEVYNKQEFIK